MQSTFDRQEQVDQSRGDTAKPVVNYISMFEMQPLTANMLRYPKTLVVKIPSGPLPEWLKGIMPMLRRQQTRNDPDYGFVTGSYTCASAASDAYVAKTPDISGSVKRTILRLAAENGWKADEQGIHTDLFCGSV
jgi:hypothetical protein